MPSPHTFRIIHCSDPHWGRQFNPEIWKDFVLKAVDRQPHLLLITGDCVDTPWGWTLNSAKRDLDELDTKLNSGRGDTDRCHIRMTPGNHDVRLTGLIPVQPWVTIPLTGLFFGAILSLAMCLGLLSFWTVFLLTTGMMVILALLHFLCISQFSRVFHNRLSSTPEQFLINNICVELFYFDSATEPILSAEGMVRLRDFITATQTPVPVPPLTNPTPQPPNQLAYRIAMTHHHAIGIPHDHQQERLMIMRNSGAFLSELTAQHIRLILHGHKHHPHFSRLTVNAERPEEFQIGVLGAGTLTRGNPLPEPHGFHFYYLELDANLNMNATPFLSHGGAFHPQPSFYIEAIHEAIRRQRTFAETAYGMKAKTLKSVTTVFPDGDTRERVEFLNFQIVNQTQRYTQLPQVSQASVDRGHIEGFIAGPLDAQCPPSLHLRPDPTRFNLREQCGQVEFGTGIYANNPPFSFFTEFHALNSVAMSVQQHEERYGKPPQPRTESTVLVTPPYPVDGLEIIIEFPAKFQIAGRPELNVENSDSQRLNIIEQEYRAGLVYDTATNVIRLTVNNPSPDTTFLIRWGLCHVEPPEARAVAHLSGTTKQLQRTLLDLSWGKNRSGLNRTNWDEFQKVARVAEDLIRDKLGVGSSAHDPLEVSLMVYDHEKACLRIIGGNYLVTDERATKTLAYGDGIAGRCHKTNAMRLFIKSNNQTTRAPFGYLPWANYPSPAGIPHEVLFCLPLTNPDEGSLIYGVLNIGSKRADSKLLMLERPADETPQKTKERDDLFLLLNMICFTALSKTIEDPPLTTHPASDTLTP
ncbi:metallophosphoesterase family protein [Nitrospira lenta]|uniref:Calcineurin-like phosphoesterase domain-containing protein n=1 Tax=Nitrospira lenta TaxID=1436998 RepID=A0A330LAV5_9BACT|nr:metallophosphoesterase [Nitrospira lenta]SPP64134.1 hypothetical protein NITLEN_100004 [Nitrospira lenta]